MKGFLLYSLHMTAYRPALSFPFISCPSVASPLFSFPLLPCFPFHLSFR